MLFVLKTAQVGKDGAFQFDDRPLGHNTITPEFGPGAPFAAESQGSVKVDPGAEAAGLEIPLERLLTIPGRVADETTGEGIA